MWELTAGRWGTLTHVPAGTSPKTQLISLSLLGKEPRGRGGGVLSLSDGQANGAGLSAHVDLGDNILIVSNWAGSKCKGALFLASQKEGVGYPGAAPPDLQCPFSSHMGSTEGRAACVLKSICSMAFPSSSARHTKPLSWGIWRQGTALPGKGVTSQPSFTFSTPTMGGGMEGW